MKKEYKLGFEMVPEECWFANLRSVLKPTEWDIVRRDAYARAKGRCSICQMPTRRLEAHERWSYDDKKALQKLEEVIALCPRCHEVKHVSYAYMRGRGADAMEQFMKVNGCSQMEFHAALAEANEEYLQRNKVEGWVTDLSWLKDKFNIEIKGLK